MSESLGPRKKDWDFSSTLKQREHAIALYSQQLYGMKRTANRLSNTSTSFQDQLQHMN